MPLRISELTTADPGFADHLQELLRRGSEFNAAVDADVRSIIDKVRTEGDKALIEFSRKFDGSQARSAADLELDAGQWEDALARVEPDVAQAIAHAAQRIRDFHQRQCEQSWQYEDEDKSILGQRVTPIERVGIYVPGGQAAYPSTVLMSAVAAKVAGVREIIMMSPVPTGRISSAVAHAARAAGVDRVFTIGGAHAIAALTYGTESVPKVDKIVGPGNVWVSAAKRQVFGHVGIDLIAGPSEVVVVCDADANPRWAAMDLFAQAEHDVDAQSILISDSAELIDAVRNEMNGILPQLERRDIVAASLERQGALIHAHDPDLIPDMIDRIAPEHLELMVSEPRKLAERVRNAGAIFCGAYSAEVLGDYCAGPNHVLPTSGAARFSSPLGVYDFQKRTSLIECSAAGAARLAATASVMAREERLTAHQRSAQCRMK